MKELSFVLSILGLVAMLGASLIKGKRMNYILFLVLLGNLLIGVSYHLDGGINGAVSCYLGAAITFVNFLFERREKAIPKWLTLIYMVAFVGLNIFVSVTGGGITLPTVIAIIAAVVFVLCVGQKNGAKYRFWTLFNVGLWILHDIVALTFGPLVSHAIQFITALTGAILHDRKDKNN